RGAQVGDGNLQINYFASAQVVEWPVAVGLPPREADAFQVRPGLRDTVRSGLGAGGATTATQVVTGDGGVGKTQLAAAVYREALASDGLDLAVWVTAASRADVLATYAQAYVRTHPGASGDADERAAAFLGS